MPRESGYIGLSLCISLLAVYLDVAVLHVGGVDGIATTNFPAYLADKIVKNNRFFNTCTKTNQSFVKR